MTKVDFCLENTGTITIVQDILDATIVSILSANGMESEHAQLLVAGVRKENKVALTKKSVTPVTKPKPILVDKSKVVKTVKLTKPLPLKKEDRLTDANTVSLVKTLEKKVKQGK